MYHRLNVLPDKKMYEYFWLERMKRLPESPVSALAFANLFFPNLNVCIQHYIVNGSICLTKNSWFHYIWFFVLLSTYHLQLHAWRRVYLDTIVLFCPFLIISRTNPWTSDHFWVMNRAPIFYQEAHFFGRQMENPNVTQSIPCNHRMTLHIHLWMTDRNAWLLSVYIHSRLLGLSFFCYSLFKIFLQIQHKV